MRRISVFFYESARPEENRFFLVNGCSLESRLSRVFPWRTGFSLDSRFAGARRQEISWVPDSPSGAEWDDADWAAYEAAEALANQAGADWHGADWDGADWHGAEWDGAESGTPAVTRRPQGHGKDKAALPD